MFVVEARGLTLGQARPEADELLELGRFTPAQLVRMLRAQRIKDGKTLAGLLWLLLLGKSRI
jgi:hypothetical protein